MESNIIERQWVKDSGDVEVEMLRGTAFTEEALAHTFVIKGIDADGAPVPLSGTVLAKFLRADDTTIDISGSVSEGVVSVTLVADCYHVPGRFSIVIYVSDGVKTVAIYAAVGNVYRGTSGKELDSGTTVPSLVQLEAAYQNALSAAASANQAAQEALAVVNVAVRYDVAQTATDAQKTQARANMGANPDVGLYLDSDGYICQT